MSDASSAQVAQQVGYQALSSSAAIAAMLGYEHGEEMNFDELFISSHASKPLANRRSVDLEAGYGATTSHIVGQYPASGAFRREWNKSRG